LDVAATVIPVVPIAASISLRDNNKESIADSATGAAEVVAGATEVVVDDVVLDDAFVVVTWLLLPPHPAASRQMVAVMTTVADVRILSPQF
jgi:hypothetical protein